MCEAERYFSVLFFKLSKRNEPGDIKDSKIIILLNYMLIAHFEHLK
jgi:hypothetical protein